MREPAVADAEGGPLPESPEPFPWPPPAGESALDALAATWWASTFRPTRFFRAMPDPPPLAPALLYYLIVGVTAAAINLFWRSLFRLLGSEGLGSFYEAMGVSPAAWSPLVNFLLSPLTLALELLVAFAVIHGLLWMLGGARRGARTTLAVLCFAYSPRLFVVVPVLGEIIGAIWMVVVAIIGLREAHRTDGWRAALAVLLPLALFFAIGLVIAVFAALAGTRLA